MAKERTEVQDIDRSLYDFRYEEKDSDFYKIKEGLTPEIVEEISDKKNDPQWMRDFRLKALEVYHKTDIPNWGPDISDLNMDNIVTYVKPKTKMSADWEEVPEDIKNTFEKLGIPEAERKSLAGVGAQYDSELVYHNLQEEVAAKGVVYSDIESALHGPYGEMIEKHFMKIDAAHQYYDFRLSSKSAAIDKADPLTALPTDRSGSSRDSNPDVGAFEYKP